MKYKQHPLSSAFPLLDHESFHALIDDIEENGVREPIVMYQDKILDGWHRYQACMELNVLKPRLVDYDGTDPVGYVLSKNLHRRHLDSTQRAWAITQLNEWQNRTGKESVNLDRMNNLYGAVQLSKAESAKLAQVGTTAIANARAATNAIQEVKDAVSSGDMGLEQAAKLSKQTPEQQLQALSDKRSGVSKPKVETVPLSTFLELQESYDEMSSNYQVLAIELSACEAVRGGEEVQEIKKLHGQISSLTRARDEWQNKCAELTKQLNYTESRLKKTK